MQIPFLSRPREKAADDSRKRIDELQARLEKSQAMRGVIENEHWPVLKEELESELWRMLEANKRLNPLHAGDAYLIIYNNGIIRGLELFLSKPEQVIAESKPSVPVFRSVREKQS